MKSRLLTAILLGSSLILAQAASGEDQGSEKHLGAIVHVPIPLAVRGKPLPVVANIVKRTGVKEVTLQVRSSGQARPRSLKMSGNGQGPYSAAIASKTTALTSEIVYRIQVDFDSGAPLKTKWYPVKVEGIEDKAKDPAKKPRKVRDLIKRHPIASGAGAVVAVGGGIAAASGGSSDSSSGVADTSASGGSDSSGGGSDSGDSEGAPQVDVSGTWSYVNSMPDETITGSWTLSQSGGSISGSFSEEGDSGSVSGTLNGNSFSLTLAFDDGTVDEISGTVSGNSMSGSWHETDTGDNGTFSANR